jgi:hypothetical protein
MFESIEIRKVKNGVIVTLRTDDEDTEYVYDTDRKAIKFVKDMLDSKNVVNVREKLSAD